MKNIKQGIKYKQKRVRRYKASINSNLKKRQDSLTNQSLINIIPQFLHIRGIYSGRQNVKNSNSINHSNANNYSM